MKELLLIAFVILGVFACGDKETGNNANANANSSNGSFCRGGTADCGCDINGMCDDAGYFCVEGVCKECPPGDENCGCLEGGMCNGDLVCAPPDPDCVALCRPLTCLPPAEPTCGPQELCDRTINECMENITEAACLDFYATPANCADIAGYTECNCECITQPTCTEYLACGTNCFNDNCM